MCEVSSFCERQHNFGTRDATSLRFISPRSEAGGGEGEGGRDGVTHHNRRLHLLGIVRRSYV